MTSQAGDRLPDMTSEASTSKLLYSAGMSLDGFIAGVGGDMSWLQGAQSAAETISSAHEALAELGGPGPKRLVPNTSLDIDDLVASIGALLIGHRTFTGDDPNRGTDAEGAFGGRWSGPSIVLTHSPPPETPDPDVTFFSDLDSAVQAAKSAAAGRYVNVLGANVAKQCLQAGVLDEVLVWIAPVLLGDGTRVFEHTGGTNIRLEPIPERSGSTSLWFRVAD